MKKLVYVLLGTLVVACTNPKEKLLGDIDKLMNQDQSFETKKGIAELQEQFVAKYPNDSNAQYFMENYINFYAKIDSNDKAIALAQQYLSTYDSSVERNNMRIIIGQALSKKGEHEQVITHFEALMKDMNVPVADLRLVGASHLALLSDTTNKERDEHQFKYAGIVEQTMGLEAAADQYKRLYTDFPTSKYAPFGMTKHADVEERNGNLDEAKKILNTLIETYPDSKFAADARIMIEQDLLGMSAEEQLDQILKNQSSN